VKALTERNTIVMKWNQRRAKKLSSLPPKERGRARKQIERSVKKYSGYVSASEIVAVEEQINLAYPFIVQAQMMPRPQR
jgi:hypothetical protein